MVRSVLCCSAIVAAFACRGHASKPEHANTPEPPAPPTYVGYDGMVDWYRAHAREAAPPEPHKCGAHVTTRVVLGRTVKDGRCHTTARGDGGAICGYVLGPNDAPLTGVTVTATSALDGSAESDITDEAGFFRVLRLPAGEYLITFFYLDCVAEHRGAHVANGDISQVDAKFEPDSSCNPETLRPW